MNFLPFLILFSTVFFSISFEVSFADTTAILPEWILTLHHYWEHSKISSIEFQNALMYLQTHGILNLTFNSEYDPITNFLITFSLQQDFVSDYFVNCSSDWYITGYFTPVEDDYLGELQQITFDNNTMYVKSDFLDSVKSEGWGKTMSGGYLGWYDETFHLNDVALDSHGNPLIFKSVAVDPQFIKQKTPLIIPDLPIPWNTIIFESSDVGPSIIGKHIDVYTGEGKESELETFQITGENNNICMN